MFVPSYLARSRHGVFYFRWPLRAALQPRRRTSMLKVSLQTHDPKEALRWSRALSYVGHAFTEYGAASGMNYEEIRRLLSTHFRELIAQTKAKIAKSGRLGTIDTAALQNGLAIAHDAVRNDGPLSVVVGNDDELMSRLIEKYGLSVQPGTAAYANLRSELKRAYRDYCSAVLDYDRSLESYGFADQTDTGHPVQPVALAASYVSLRHLADHYTKDSKLGEQWVAKTQHEKADHIFLLIELLSADTDVSTIATAHAQRVKEVLIRYPRNRNKDPRTRGLALDEALNVEGVQPINVQTINKYLQTYRTMFGWAKRNGYVASNVFEGLGVRRGKKQSKATRYAFSQAQVQIILRELVQNDRGFVRLEYQKWGPLIALYTGARLNEIAQIHLSDIRQQDGIWCFHINDDDDTKQVKTDASRRFVPIHTRLVQLGLLDHVQRLRHSGAQKLFQDFHYCEKNGWGRSLGRWFNDRFLVQLELKGKGISFHSFRHTVTTGLYHADVPDPIVKSIIGHEREGVTQQHYHRSGYKIAQLRDALEKLSYDCSDLSPDPGHIRAGKGGESVSLKATG